MNLEQKFEQILAFHCAPTFVGIKAANLIALQKEGTALGRIKYP